MTTSTKIKITKTEKVIADMLVENTGTHFLDSGGAYGRAWQRNQGMTAEHWKAQPRAWFDGFDGVTISLFHYLTERLEYSPRWQRKFDGLARRKDQKETSWWELEALFLEEQTGFNIMEEEAKAEKRGYNHHAKPPWEGWNSYNMENNLSQDIQWTEVELPVADEEEAKRGYTERVIILTIHGGADARGGYTAPKFFTLLDADSPIGYGMDEFELWCDWEPPVNDTPPLPGMPTTPIHENHGFTVRAGEITDRDGCGWTMEDLWPEPVNPENHGGRYDNHVMDLPDPLQTPEGPTKTAWACPTCWTTRKELVPLQVDAAYCG